MKNILAALAVMGILTGCVVAPVGYTADVSYEPSVVVGLYPLGYYNPGYGYWTGYGWDVDFYGYGHPGYGHFYRGAPGYARGHYAPRGRIGGGHVGGFHHR
jgi:hypothetical protein